MKTLRAYRNAWRFARFEPNTGTFQKLPLLRTLRWREVLGDGWYAELGRHRFCLYVSDGALYLQSQGVTIPLDSEAEVGLTDQNGLRLLQVRRRGKSIAAEYERPSTWIPLDQDPTPFVEEEHFDFGLFIYHLSRAPRRVEQIVSMRARHSEKPSY